MNVDVLLAAVLGGAIASVIGGVFGHFAKKREFAHQREMKALELKHQRFNIALELARSKNEQIMALGRAGRSVELWDPGVSLADYLEAVDEIDRTGRWKRGDLQAYPAGVPSTPPKVK